MTSKIVFLQPLYRPIDLLIMVIILCHLEIIQSMFSREGSERHSCSRSKSFTRLEESIEQQKEVGSGAFKPNHLCHQMSIPRLDPALGSLA